MPLLDQYKGSWLLSPSARDAVLAAKSARGLVRRLRVLWYVAPEPADTGPLVDAWLQLHDRITSGDYSTLTGLTTAGARRSLERLVDEGQLVRGETSGRNAHFRRLPSAL